MIESKLSRVSHDMQTGSSREDRYEAPLLLAVARSVFCLFAGGSIAVLLLTPVRAAEIGDADSLTEIVVTAQRREENLQRVPITVDVLSQANLVDTGITDTSALNGKVPALVVSQNGPGNQYFIRGVGTLAAAPNGEQSVATYIDGVYLYAPFGNFFPFADNIQRIEVLKGPQGTLFGRNSTGGVINIITKDPSHLASGDASVSYGNYDTVTASFYGTIGITDTLATDLSVFDKHMGDGYGVNLTTGQPTYKADQTSIRSKWLWTPLDGTEIRAAYSYVRVDGNTNPQQILRGSLGLNGVSTTPPYDSSANYFQNWEGISNLTSLQVDQNVGFATIENIAGYRTVSPGKYVFDVDSTAADIIDATVNYPSHVISDELRMLSQKDSTVSWVGGIYYLNAVVNDFLVLGGPGVIPPPLQIGENDTFRSWSFAPYAQATVPIGWDTKLTGGVRYNYEKLNHLGSTVEVPLGNIVGYPLVDYTIERNTSWRVSLDHQWTPEIMTYVSSNRSFKSGGYNPVGTHSALYLPEELTAEEVGVKSELFNDRLRFNLSGYYYDYINIQIQTNEQTNVVTSNGPSAYIKGIDADWSWDVFKGLEFSGGLNYGDGHYGGYPHALAYAADPTTGSILIDATNHRTVMTPRWSSSLAIDYALDSSVGTFAFNANAVGRTLVYSAPANRLGMPGYVVQNDSLAWTPRESNFTTRLWVLNAFNRAYLSEGLETALGDTALWAPPRTYGVSFSVKFGEGAR